MSFIKNSQGIIINTDDSHYKAILAQRESQKQALSVCKQMDALKDELAEIKAVLAQVINRK
jgi:hypothetical protein